MPFTMPSGYRRGRVILPQNMNVGNRRFSGDYIPTVQNGVGLKLYLYTVIYTATSSSLGRVGGTSLSSRAARRR